MGIEDHKTETGKMRISSVALAVLDLFRYSQASGGIDNIATVLSALGHKIDTMQLTTLSALVERPVVLRLGYLLDFIGYDTLIEPLLEALHALSWAELDRHSGRERSIVPLPRLREFITCLKPNPMVSCTPTDIFQSNRHFC